MMDFAYFIKVCLLFFLQLSFSLHHDYHDEKLYKNWRERFKASNHTHQSECEKLIDMKKSINEKDKYEKGADYGIVDLNLFWSHFHYWTHVRKGNAVIMESNLGSSGRILEESFFVKCLGWYGYSLNVYELFEPNKDCIRLETPTLRLPEVDNCSSNTIFSNNTFLQISNDTISIDIWYLPDQIAESVFVHYNISNLMAPTLVILWSRGADRSLLIEEALSLTHEYTLDDSTPFYSIFTKIKHHGSVSSFKNLPGDSSQASSSLGIKMLDKLFCGDRLSMRNLPWRESFVWKNCPTYFKNTPQPYSSISNQTERIGLKIIPGSPVILIMIIFHDKLTDLKELLRSLHEIVQSSFEVVIYDPASSIPEVLSYLRLLETSGVKIIRDIKLWKIHALPGRINKHIKAYMDGHPETQYYAVTDCDMSFSGVNGNILAVYSQILDAFPTCQAVGPHMRIDDVPNDSISVKVKGSEYFFKWESNVRTNNVRSVTINSSLIYFTETQIDTTFALHRRDHEYTSMYQTKILQYRVLEPFAIRHIDWYYQNDFKLQNDMKQYFCRSYYENSITHTRMDASACVINASNPYASYRLWLYDF